MADARQKAANRLKTMALISDFITTCLLIGYKYFLYHAILARRSGTHHNFKSSSEAGHGAMLFARAHAGKCDMKSRITWRRAVKLALTISQHPRYAKSGAIAACCRVDYHDDDAAPSARHDVSNIAFAKMLERQMALSSKISSQCWRYDASRRQTVARQARAATSASSHIC